MKIREKHNHGKNDEGIEKIKSTVRTILDFPKKGILYYDITTLLKDKSVFKECVEKMADHFKNKDIDIIASTESRGSIFGAALAYEMGTGFVPIRKKGKLPFLTETESYGKEYGKDEIEIHKDAIKPKQNILLVDDLLATGGTIKASADLYQAILAKIEQNDYDVFNRRAYLSNTGKFRRLPGIWWHTFRYY